LYFSRNISNTVNIPLRCFSPASSYFRTEKLSTLEERIWGNCETSNVLFVTVVLSAHVIPSPKAKSSKKFESHPKARKTVKDTKHWAFWRREGSLRPILFPTPSPPLLNIKNSLMIQIPHSRLHPPLPNINLGRLHNPTLANVREKPFTPYGQLPPL
jgi:hypothetical protein